MLADYWVIAQLLTQFFSFLFLLGALIFSVRIIRLWAADEATELQLYLERRSYLVGSMVQLVLMFQVLSLLMFLHTANNHLPGIVKGAMCATGSLGVNEYGFGTLYLKMAAIFFYVAFLILNYLDNSEPAYPLTPIKYWLVFPAFLLVAVDYFYMFNFFWEIKPDIIATCCSVNFIDSESFGVGLEPDSKFRLPFAILFIGLFFLLMITQGMVWLRPKFFNMPKTALGGAFFQLIGSFLYVFAAVIVLKFSLVKYIYGLPSHNCLFDIFWAKYNYVGYLIFGSYYGLVVCALFLLLYRIFQHQLQNKHEYTLQKLRLYYLIFLGMSFCIPVFYWMTWKGNL